VEVSGRRIVAGVAAGLIAALGLGVVVPRLAGGVAVVPESVLRGFLPGLEQDIFQSHAWIAAEVAGVLTVGIALFIYFWIAEPRVIILRPSRKRD